MDEPYKRLVSDTAIEELRGDASGKKKPLARRSKTFGAGNVTFAVDKTPSRDDFVQRFKTSASSSSMPLGSRVVSKCSMDNSSNIGDTDCPITPVTHCSSKSAPCETAIHSMHETKAFDFRVFDYATAEAYYLVHHLRGTVLFRVVEMASQDELRMPELDNVLTMLSECDPDDVEMASLASYEHYGTNQIHVMHWAASLGNVAVMSRLMAHYGDEVINLRSTITKEASNGGSKKGEDSASLSSKFFPSVSRSATDLGPGGTLPRSCSASREHYAPLMSALYMSRTEGVIWLLDNKADPNLANIDGQTAIHLLAKTGLPYESVWKQDEAAEKLTMKLVECKADMDAKTRYVEHLPKWQCGKTALQLAASKMSQYPKHMLFLLAKSFQSPELSEPLKELTLIAQVNPSAAESLMEIVRANRTVRKQLLLEVHSRTGDEPLTDLVEVMRTAAPAAADVLEMLTFRPQVKSLQKNPLPPYARLENRQMLCTYKPDVSEGVAQHMLEHGYSGAVVLPMPIWDYQDPQIDWHRKFQWSGDHALNEDSKVYKVEVKVLHLPGVLDFRVPHALYTLSESPRLLEIFGRVPVQAIVECLWEQVRNAHRLNLGIEVLVLVMLLLIGYSPVEDSWHPTDSKLGSVIVAKVIYDFVNMVSITYLMHWYTKSSLRSHFCNLGVVWEFMCYVLLAILAAHANYGSEPAGESVNNHGCWETLIATNIFMRFLHLLRLCRTLQGFGETVISVQKSIPKIWNMILLMTLVFVSFACIFLVIKDKDKSTQYVLLYLWIGMMFGEGDGIENISGFDTDHENFNGGGSPVVVQASIIFMMIASFLFAVVLMNLMIAIYSNYYEEMVPIAPFVFQKTRAKDCAYYMLRPALPACLANATGLKWCRRCAHSTTVLLISLWLLLERRTSWGRCLGIVLASALLLLQATLLLHKWHVGPEDRRLYLWVCYRADFHEVSAGTGAQWQRHVKTELASLQRGMEEMRGQMEHLTEAVLKLAGDDRTPAAQRKGLRRVKTWSLPSDTAPRPEE